MPARTAGIESGATDPVCRDELAGETAVAPPPYRGRMADDAEPRDLTEAERIKLRTAKSALTDALNREHDSDAREAAFQQFMQTGNVYRETRDALHVPEDAGEYAEGLRAILLRIPDGWGRWISCSAGWYPLICELDSALAQLDPDYTVHQCKEKFGRLCYYAHSGRPGVGAEFRALIDAAEAHSGVTCELCGATGALHSRAGGGWVKTVCPVCAAAGGWELIGELVEELTPDRSGVWEVTTADGVEHYFDLRFGRYGGSDEDTRELAAIDLWPRLGDGFRVFLDGGEDGDEWRVVEAAVTRIERIR